ncbi:MAG: response regulator transcription factor [Saprospiraceae bacterium]|nr:response regulator transcription factor [Saprospiraceae bacterium]
MQPKIKILIIEDEPLIARDLKRICTKLGYHVIGIAYQSSQALDMLHSRSYDLILSDINIKGHLDGIEIGKIIREKYDKPLIYVTSFADINTIHRAKETTPNGYVVKPFDEKDIYSSIEIALFNVQKQIKPEFSRAYLIQKLDVHLTRKEFDIIEDIIRGITNPQMANKYFVSENTIKTHIKNIYAKLDVHSKAELTRVVLE